MVHLTGPLFSEKARKQLGHKLVYKRKGNRSLLTRYSKPGSVKPFTPSASQKTMRDYYYEAVGKWRSLTANEKKQWRDFVK